MRKLLLLLFLICTFNYGKAQTICDSLFGEWGFTRWQADQLFVDIEDYAATMKYQFQKFKDEPLRGKYLTLKDPNNGQITNSILISNKNPRIYLNKNIFIFIFV